jgi:hypothetical protein
LADSSSCKLRSPFPCTFIRFALFCPVVQSKIIWIGITTSWLLRLRGSTRKSPIQSRVVVTFLSTPDHTATKPHANFSFTHRSSTYKLKKTAEVIDAEDLEAPVKEPFRFAWAWNTLAAVLALESTAGS